MLCMAVMQAAPLSCLCLYPSESTLHSLPLFSPYILCVCVRVHLPLHNNTGRQLDDFGSAITAAAEAKLHRAQQAQQSALQSASSGDSSQLTSGLHPYESGRVSEAGTSVSGQYRGERVCVRERATECE